MENVQEFVDFYAILQVNPNCDPKVLESVYRHLAKVYHPDRADTADVAKFNEVTDAYSVLRDPGRRAEYDRSYFSRFSNAFGESTPQPEMEVDETTAIKDAEMHERILLYLYNRRRKHASDAGVIGWFIQEAFDCSDENFEFHVWYLKSKGFIDTTEAGTLAITIQGVDHVISTCRSSLSEKLLIVGSASSRE